MPESRRTLPKGYMEKVRFIHEVAANHQDDECLFWPYGTTGSGYGRIKSYGKEHLIHRIVCEIANGPSPSPDHQVAHSCGNGHLGCVSAGHLRWATVKENALDRTLHGTQARGSKSNKAKLTEEQVLSIRGLGRRLPHSEIGRRFGVSKQTIQQICAGKTWAHVMPLPPLMRTAR